MSPLSLCVMDQLDDCVNLLVLLLKVFARIGEVRIPDNSCLRVQPLLTRESDPSELHPGCCSLREGRRVSGAPVLIVREQAS
jgi:hypothetical protein